MKYIENIAQQLIDIGVEIDTHQVRLTEMRTFTFNDAQLEALLHQELQKARQDWLREEIVKLEERQRGWLGKEEDGSDRHPNYDELQTIIDRYHSELDQDVSK